MPDKILPFPRILSFAVKTRGHKGIVESQWTYNAEIEIVGLKKFRPAKGVLISEGEAGLIGLDILNQCEIQMVGGVFLLEAVKNEPS